MKLITKVKPFCPITTVLIKYFYFGKKHIQHFYIRAGFGILPKKLKELEKKAPSKVVKNLFDTTDQFEEFTILAS